MSAGSSDTPAYAGRRPGARGPQMAGMRVRDHFGAVSAALGADDSHKAEARSVLREDDVSCI